MNNSKQGDPLEEQADPSAAGKASQDSKDFMINSDRVLVGQEVIHSATYSKNSKECSEEEQADREDHLRDHNNRLKDKISL